MPRASRRVMAIEHWPRAREAGPGDPSRTEGGRRQCHVIRLKRWEDGRARISRAFDEVHPPVSRDTRLSRDMSPTSADQTQSGPFGIEPTHGRAFGFCGSSAGAACGGLRTLTFPVVESQGRHRSPYSPHRLAMRFQ